MNRRPDVPVPSKHEVDAPAARWPERRAIDGHWCRLEPLSAAAHGEPLARHALASAARDSWAYLPYGPFADADAYCDHLARQAAADDPLAFIVRDRDGDGDARGVATLMSIVPAHGRIEIGHIWFAPALQRTRAASEAVMLLAMHAFALGNRRLEWKCDAANDRSRRAAQRFGFAFEGIHRRHMVVKGCNRDTAWYSIVDTEWPAVRAAFDAWRDPVNFDADGRQREPLRAAPVGDPTPAP